MKIFKIGPLHNFKLLILHFSFVECCKLLCSPTSRIFQPFPQTSCAIIPINQPLHISFTLWPFPLRHISYIPHQLSSQPPRRNVSDNQTVTFNRIGFYAMADKWQTVGWSVGSGEGGRILPHRRTVFDLRALAMSWSHDGGVIANT
jgi:hypothetical protein